MSVLTAVDLILAIPAVILAITPPLHDHTFRVGAVEPVCSLLTELSCRHRPVCMTEVREAVCSLLTELSCRHRPECMTKVREAVCSLPACLPVCLSFCLSVCLHLYPLCANHDSQPKDVGRTPSLQWLTMTVNPRTWELHRPYNG